MCLGREEWAFHQNKDTGPEFNLNQLFINELSALQSVELKPEFHRKVCEEGLFTPSVNLMRAILIHGRKIFDIRPLEDESQSFREMRVSGVATLESETPHIFFRYLAQKQIQMNYAHCFRDELPELQEFIDQYLYLEEDLPYESLIRDKDKFRRIFERLNNFEAIRKRCFERQKELESKRNLNTHTKR